MVTKIEERKIERLKQEREQHQDDIIAQKELRQLLISIGREIASANRRLAPVDQDIKILTERLMSSWWPDRKSFEEVPKREVMIEIADPETGEITTKTVYIPLWPNQPPPINLHPEAKQFRIKINAERDEVIFSNQKQLTERDYLKERWQQTNTKIEALGRRIAAYRKRQAKSQPQIEA